MIDAAKRREQANDNVPDTKIEAAMKEVERVMDERTNKGEFTADVIVTEVVAEHVYRQLEQKGYKIKTKPSGLGRTRLIISW